MPEAAREVTGARWIPPAKRVMWLALWQILLSVAGILLNDQSYRLSGVSLIWLANGFLIGALLGTPRQQWPGFLVVAYTIDFCVNLEQQNPAGTAAFFALCNMSEVLVASALMYPAVAPRADLTEWRQFRSFLLYGVLLAPAAASVMATLFLSAANGMPAWHSLRFWFAADVVGIATTTPLYFSIEQRREFSPQSRLEVAGLFLLLIAVTQVVFYMTTYPTLWALVLMLLLFGIRLGFAASAAGLLVVTFLGGYWTIQGAGPFGPQVLGSLATRIVIFQAFVAVSMFALYGTEVVMSSKRRVLQCLEASESQFRSIAEASLDVILLTDMDGIRRYVSPAVAEVLGWEPEELVGLSYRQLAHEEDVPKIQQVLEDLIGGRTRRPLAYRALKKNGDRLWMEASSRVLRKRETGEPTGFVHVLRDISDRKAAEEKMQEAFEVVELQALRDGLTGVANRRLLDLTLTREWLNGCREGTSLSVLLIDVDRFKAFNDRYGHLEGDECLRRVASEMQSVLQRPLDLLARFGGEEFVAVLPNTREADAELLAELVRRAVEACGVAHADSAEGVVTVSVGCASMIPTSALDESCLLSAADAALYRAKAGGRNCIKTAWETTQVS